jgi:hypothetical protein
MKHLVKSFQEHLGQRGVHFYDETGCNFLNWTQVFEFMKTFPNGGEADAFSEKLTDAMANYDPQTEYLAVQQRGKSISVEIYTDSRTQQIKGKM